MNRFDAWLCTTLIPDFKYFSPEQKYEVYDGLIENNLTLKEVKVYAKLELDSDVMCSVKYWMAHGISYKDMEILLEKEISVWRVNRLCEGIKAGFTRDEIMSCLDPSLSDEQVFEIFGRLEKSKLKKTKVAK